LEQTERTEPDSNRAKRATNLSNGTGDHPFHLAEIGLQSRQVRADFD
jgi:hypothetical protein